MLRTIHRIVWNSLVLQLVHWIVWLDYFIQVHGVRTHNLLVLLLVEAHCLRGLLAKPRLSLLIHYLLDSGLLRSCPFGLLDQLELLLVRLALIVHDYLHGTGPVSRVRWTSLDLFGDDDRISLLAQQFIQRQLGCGKKEARIRIVDVYRQVLIFHIFCKLDVFVFDLADGRVDVKLDREHFLVVQSVSLLTLDSSMAQFNHSILGQVIGLIWLDDSHTLPGLN